jgi:predicted MFS family arabinose efflux permease
VGRRARTARAQAASLYLLCYYGGSSVIGWLGGLVYGQGGWPALVAMIAGLVVVALVAAARLAAIPPVEADWPRVAAP